MSGQWQMESLKMWRENNSENNLGMMPVLMDANPDSGGRVKPHVVIFVVEARGC